MSFTTEKIKPVSKKITLIEISLPLFHDNWINFEAGIWFYTLTPASPSIADAGGGDDWTYSAMNDVIYQINSLVVDAQTYSSVSTLANLHSTNKSFLWDQGSQTLYVHFNAFKPYYLFTTIKAGAATGYSNRSLFSDNDIYYSGKLKALPDINQTKDPLFFGLISHDGGAIAFDNTDGEFDAFVTNDLFGQEVTGKFGFDSLAVSSFETIFVRYIESFDFNYREFNINAFDKRKKLNRNLPVNRFDTSTYPDLNADDVGKPIPLVWGSVRGCPMVITNKDEVAPGNYEVKLCDITNHEIKAGQTPVVYVNGESVTVSNFDETAGTCTIAVGDYDPDKNPKVTADFIGFVDGGNDEIENSLDVLADIFTDYLDIPYNSDNYDITEWEAEQANTYDVGLFVGEEISVHEIIELICRSNIGILLVKNNGLYTFRTYDSSRFITKTIPYDELFTEGDLGFPELEVVYPSEEYLTSAVVKYSKNWSDNTYRQIDNTTYEDEVFAVTGVYNEHLLETILVNSTDADAVALAIMLRHKEIIPTLTVKTSCSNIDLEIMEFIVLETEGGGRVLFGGIICEIVGLSKDMISGETQITAKYVRNVQTKQGDIYDGGDATFTTWDHTYDGDDAPRTHNIEHIIDAGEILI